MNVYSATMIRVIDGDTVHFDIEIGLRNLWLRNVSCRLARINAPELSTPEGPPARDHLIKLIQAIGPVCVVGVKGSDKYGRLLVEIPTVNDRMVADGFAVPMLHEQEIFPCG